MPLVDGPDCVLNAVVLGSGRPVTLFAHGLTGSSDEMLPLASPMRGTRVLLDFRGHGGSASPDEAAGYDHPAMRRDVEAIAERFHATRCAAQSMGAGAVLNLLADRPDRFERIALISPASIDGPNDAATSLFLEMARRLEVEPLEEITAWSLEGSSELIRRRPQWGEEIRGRVRRMNPVGIPRALRGYVQGRPPVSDASLLQRVVTPALILGCREDPIHDVAVAERLAALLPNSTLKVWDEPLGMFDDRESLATEIERFFDA